MRDPIVLASWKINSEDWFSYVSERKKKSSSPWPIYIVFGAIIITILGGSTITAWWIASAYGVNFYERFIVAWAVVSILNVIDWFIIALLSYTWLYPLWMRLEGIAPLYQPWERLRVGLISIGIGVPCAAIAAGLTLLVQP
ncbi:MAG: hypothetical protein AAGF93_11890 [Cyanobacteria bacterium P01_H01_bin.105]